ncbi:MAG TPA: hypothetical protein PK926_15280 [Spirochaetota bacterium]|nr:hypothetical protein [Spirochaetota bacterium]HPI91015.1 hypothetical protein [Spirochaetota bacterium]HPR48605.1 hypothetical protein [Spirochaetota bacterium]
MKKYFSIAAIIIFLGLFQVVLLAQEKTVATPSETKAEDKTEKKPDKGIDPPLGLSGKMYLELKVDTLKDGKETTSIALTRAYLTYERVLWGPVSFNITSDIGTGMKSKDKNNTVEVSGQTYEFYIKTAYLQVAHSWDFLALKGQVGIIGTPAIGVAGKMQDLRWVYNDYSFDKSDKLGVETGDTSADVGASLSTRIFKYVELNYAICHGEGYKNPVESYDGKSHYGTISIIPYKWVYINGFINYERTEKFKTNYYYGGGLAFVSDFLKAGANYVLHGVKKGDVGAYTYHLVESWVHFNLGSFVNQAPVLVIGRMAWGVKNADLDHPTLLLAGGAGYQFNKHLRLLAYYESYKPKGEAATAAFYIKSEAKF